MCVEEVPLLKSLAQEFADQGLTLVGVSLDHDRQALSKMVAEKEIHWPQVFDGKGKESELMERFDVLGTPTLFLIDPEGRIATKGLAAPDLRPSIVQVLANQD